MLADSHCHLNCLDLSPHQQELSKAIQAARHNDVSYMLCVAIDEEHWPQLFDIAEQDSKIYASVGVHPNEMEGHDPSLAELIQAAAHPRVVAIGETGLDYYRSEAAHIPEQQARFRRHIAAAKQCNKPIIIHMRDAAADTLRIMREENAAEVGGVMHCFTDTWEVAKQAIDLNFYISFSGIVTFKNATDLQAVAKLVPLERLLIETDAPYLAPAPHRGKPNEPAYLKHTAEFLATLRGIDYETLAKATTQNFLNLFKLG